MNRNMKGCLLALAVAGLGAACNPTVDPNATFTAQGTVVDASGQPLIGAEVRLIKYSSDLNLFAPSVETLFADVPTNDDELGLRTSIVKTAQTDMSGRFTMSFLGSDIQAENGVMTTDGRVEVGTTVIVVRDPSDGLRRAGVYSYPYVFQDADKVWDSGSLNLWSADAKANTGSAATTGLVDFTWKRLDRIRTTDVKNAYRIDVFGTNTARLVIRCSEGDVVEGGCARDPSDATRLLRSVSALSLYSFYSDPNGMFSAYVQASGADYRYVSRFVVSAPVPDVRNDRDQVGLEGVWAVGTGADQPLLATAATDGDPRTRVAITNNATALYVKLPLSNITDAGILNTLVRDAAHGCVVLEFSVNAFTDITAAKSSESSAWTRKGKFCGETGGAGEVSALAGFSTTSQDGVAAAWMRLRAEPDAGSGAAVIEFQAVGEVAIYKQRGM